MSAEIAGTESTDNTVVAEATPTDVNANSETENAEVTEAVLGEATNEVALGEGEDLLGGKDEPQGEAIAPDNYENFIVPNGADVDEASLSAFASDAKELNLNQTQAQALLEKQLSVQKDQAEALVAQKAEQKRVWVDELTKDAEYGGSKLKETVERANRSLRTFDTTGNVVKLLKETGQSNNPDIIKLFSNIDARLGEKTLVEGAVIPDSDKSDAQKMFDHPSSQS